MTKRNTIILVTFILLQLTGTYLLFTYDQYNFAKNIALIALTIFVISGSIFVTSMINKTKNSNKKILGTSLLTLSIGCAIFILYHTLYHGQRIENFQQILTIVIGIVPVISMQLIALKEK